MAEFDLDKYRSIGVNTHKGDWGVRSKEWRDDASGRVKKTRDELGNYVTQHAKGDRQDVQINAGTVEAGLTLQ